MDVQTITLIVSGLLGALSIFLGVKFDVFKKKFGQAKDLMKEASDVLVVAADAAADNKISSEEGEKIKKEVLEMVGAFKVLIGKSG